MTHSERRRSAPRNSIVSCAASSFAAQRVRATSDSFLVDPKRASSRVLELLIDTLIELYTSLQRQNYPWGEEWTDDELPFCSPSDTLTLKTSIRLPPHVTIE